MNWRETLSLWLYTWAKIPLLFAARPRVMQLNDERVCIRITLRRKTRNHVGSMYFGALCIGADISPGLLTMRHIKAARKPGTKAATLVFKDMHADFLRRAMGHVDFVCEDGPAISTAVAKAVATGERQNIPVRVVAKVVDETVAAFTLTLSVK